MAWIFRRQGALSSQGGACLLKELEQHERPVRKRREGSVSGGLPCNMASLRRPGSLFCFALVRPRSPDGPLLLAQRSLGAGLFACDALALFSNETFEAAPGVKTQSLRVDLEGSSGGEYGPAMDLNAFMAVWREVAHGEKFREHDWTVKVDVQTVFLPGRLRRVLPHHPEAREGVVLNNCRFGLHGPIEVLSRRAVEAWIAGAAACFRRFTKLCSGPCGWGEDVFLDQCLVEVLGVRRDNEWALLKEVGCTGHQKLSTASWTPNSCRTRHIAFHPFRTNEAFSQCLSNAQHPSS